MGLSAGVRGPPQPANTPRPCWAVRPAHTFAEALPDGHRADLMWAPDGLCMARDLRVEGHTLHLLHVPLRLDALGLCAHQAHGSVSHTAVAT